MSENKELEIAPKKELDSSKQKDSAKVDEYSTFENFNENTLRVRRNLLIFSVIALFYKLSGATLTGKFSFLGLEFDHIDPEMIDLFLLWIVIYHLIHFVWLAFEHYQHNIISLTRVGEKFHRDTVAKGINLKDNSWNLYMWWNENKYLREGIKNYINQIYKPINQISEGIKNGSKEELEFRLNSFKELLTAYETRIGEKITSSLNKFNNSYKNYSLTNRWRWLVLETGIPVLMGLSALNPEILKFLIRVI